LDTRIQTALGDVEAAHRVIILYACESGSRAWGFASPDSDYDVRFLYVHPPSWYLSVNLERKRDVIEHSSADDLDVVGWDIRKALGLYNKSNAPLMEWLGSPIIYYERVIAAPRMREMMPVYYQRAACMHHYLRMARTTVRQHLQGEMASRKGYFYALRPLLAIRWIEAGLGIVPTEFAKLLDANLVTSALGEAMKALVIEKAQAAELDQRPRIRLLDQFIEAELGRLKAASFDKEPSPPIEPLDALFQSILTEAYGSAG
jgi:uncharacterized protein